MTMNNHRGKPMITMSKKMGGRRRNDTRENRRKSMTIPNRERKSKLRGINLLNRLLRLRHPIILVHLQEQGSWIFPIPC
jgi:hypothetical protein